MAPQLYYVFGCFLPVAIGALAGGCASRPIADINQFPTATDVAVATIKSDLAAQSLILSFNKPIRADAVSIHITRLPEVTRLELEPVTLNFPRFAENLGAFCRAKGGTFTSGSGEQFKSAITQGLRDAGLAENPGAFASSASTTIYRCSSAAVALFTGLKTVFTSRPVGNTLVVNEYVFVMHELSKYP